MITVDEAFGTIRGELVPLDQERVSLEEAHGRVWVRMSWPTGMNLLLTGAQWTDLHFQQCPLPGRPGSRGTIAAGDLPSERALSEGECDAIMTGAPIPAGGLT